MGSLVVHYSESRLSLIAGDWGEPGYHLTFEDPWGNRWQAMSGSKPEYGPGGFECGAHPPGEPYTIEAGIHSWEFEHRAGLTFLTWTADEPDDEPEDEPDDEPDDEPEPGRIEVLPGREYSAVLEGDTIRWVEGEVPGAVWVYRGYVLPGARLWLPEAEPARPMLAAWLAEMRARLARLERGVGGL